MYRRQRLPEWRGVQFHLDAGLLGVRLRVWTAPALSRSAAAGLEDGRPRQRWKLNVPARTHKAARDLADIRPAPDLVAGALPDSAIATGTRRASRERCCGERAEFGDRDLLRRGHTESVGARWRTEAEGICIHQEFRVANQSHTKLAP
jgi:hypothetical protein